MTDTLTLITFFLSYLMLRFVILELVSRRIRFVLMPLVCNARSGSVTRWSEHTKQSSGVSASRSSPDGNKEDVVFLTASAASKE